MLTEFSPDLLKTSSTSANGRRRRRQQAHRDREGANFFWCQGFMVPKISGAKEFWCQKFLVAKIFCGRGFLWQRCHHHLLSCSQHSFSAANTSFDLCVCLVGMFLDAGILNSFEGDTRILRDTGGILMHGRVTAS